MIKFNSYTIKARIFPSIITALPFLLLVYTFKANYQVNSILAFIKDINILSITGINVVLIYFFMMLIRTISKYYERQYFILKKGFPTAYFLLYDNTRYSKELKDRYRAKVFLLFGISIPNSGGNFSTSEEIIKLLSEATKQIILLIGDGKLVKEHNIWYGFIRNLIGGCLIALLFSLLGSIIYTFIIPEKILSITFLFFAFIYYLLLLFNKNLIINTAEEYANQLISEFLALN
jgi:hypothetical protein